MKLEISIKSSVIWPADSALSDVSASEAFSIFVTNRSYSAFFVTRS